MSKKGKTILGLVFLVFTVVTLAWAKPYILGKANSGTKPNYYTGDVRDVGFDFSLSKEDKDKVLVPRQWGKLVGVASGLVSTNDVALFFQADDGTIYIVPGFKPKYGPFVFRGSISKINRTANN